MGIVTIKTKHKKNQTLHISETAKLNTQHGDQIMLFTLPTGASVLKFIGLLFIKVPKLVCLYSYINISLGLIQCDKH